MTMSVFKDNKVEPLGVLRPRGADYRKAEWRSTTPD